MKHWLFCLIVCFIQSSNAEPWAITNARIFAMEHPKPIENGTVVIEDDTIIAVGADVDLAAVSDIVDAKGKTLTPGFTAASSQLGLLEIEAVAATHDYSSDNSMQTASFSVLPGYNFNSTLIPYNRLGGITRAVILPRAVRHVIAGRGSIVSLADSQQPFLQVNSILALDLASRGAKAAGGSTAAALTQWRTTLQESRDFKAFAEDVRAGAHWQYQMGMHDLVALAPFTHDRGLIIVNVNRASDILSVLRIAKDYALNIAIQGGAEAWLVAADLAQQDIPVIIDPMNNIPSDFDHLAARLESATLLHQAGVTILLTARDSHNLHLIRQAAGNAVAHGLPYYAALQALTSNPAQVFAMSDYGQIAANKRADLLLWDGDPLEVTSYLELLVINGQRLPLVSRATKLRDRYKPSKNTTIAPAYRK